MATLEGRTVIITGASRGIGRAIALRCAKDGANVVIAAKTTEERGDHLKGTIHSVAREVEEAGGKALALPVDVRDDAQVAKMAATAAEFFGGIDVMVNNAGAIRLTGTRETPMKRFDLMLGVNVRAAFACAQACLPWLEKSSQAHVLNMSPPISLDPRWLKNHVAYTISKYGMSMCTIGMAAELADSGIAVNSLWPRTTIATVALEVLAGDEAMKASRTPEIMADAAYEVITTHPKALTGQTLLDEPFLRSRGVTDFSKYAVDPTRELMTDFYVEG